MSDAFANAGGIEIAAGDLVVEAKIGSARAALDAIMIRRMAAARAESEGIVVEDSELDRALSDFYVARNLMEDEQISKWLDTFKLQDAEVRGRLREELLADRLRARLVPDSAVLKHYQASPHDYARVRVEILEAETAGMASEIMLAVREGETDWTKAAERAGGAELTELERKHAPEEIAASLFAARPGALVGPLMTPRSTHAVYRVVSRTSPELTDALREKIRNERFEAEIRRGLVRKPFRYLA